MKQTAWNCLAALVVAAWTAGAPLPAVAEETIPATGVVNSNSGNSPPKVAASLAPSGSSTRRESYPFHGVVASVDAPSKTLTLEGKASKRVIAVTPETRLTRDGSSASLEEVKAGERVGGTVKKNPDGREEAVLLRVGLKAKEVGEGKAAKKSKKRQSKAASGDQ